MAEEIKPDTLEFIFEFTRDAPEQQIQSAEALDNKVTQLFSVASVVIGLAGLSGSGSDGAWLDWLLVVALGFFVLTAILSLAHLFPKVQWRSLHADVLWSKYWQDEVSDIKHALADDIQKAYGRNNKVLERKSLLLKFVVVTTGMEVLLVGIGLVLSRFA